MNYNTTCIIDTRVAKCIYLNILLVIAFVHRVGVREKLDCLRQTVDKFREIEPGVQRHRHEMCLFLPKLQSVGGMVTWNMQWSIPLTVKIIVLTCVNLLPTLGPLY